MAVSNRPSLPFKGVHLMLGNDLAGDKVVVNPILTDIDQPPDPINRISLVFTHLVPLQGAWQRHQNRMIGDIDSTNTLRKHAYSNI